MTTSLGRILWLPKCFKTSSPHKEGHHIPKGFISKALPAVGIDVVHHAADVSLRIMVKSLSFWDEVSYELMVPLGSPFLVGADRSQ